MDDSKEVEARSETDRLVDGLNFGELCNDFECISSPYVESTARQIARDILEIRQDNRALSCYAVAVKYKVRLPAPLQLPAIYRFNLYDDQSFFYPLLIEVLSIRVHL